MSDNDDPQAESEALETRTREILARYTDRELVVQRWLAEVEAMKLRDQAGRAQRRADALAAEVECRELELDAFVTSSVDEFLAALSELDRGDPDD
ncbi:MAG: hypothetical protein CL424_14600 [Acidimicrobiaceae bacterium]|nr:hypothetical protein [Acidimicrobiaceae bacterium]